MIVSVESDEAWIGELSKKDIISQRLKNGTIKFVHVDIGPVGDWGIPKDESKIRNWPRYCLGPFGNGLEYKYIWVDGQFRNACAYASWAFMFEDMILAVHDYTVRSAYYEMEKFCEILDRTDTLVPFWKKNKLLMSP